MSVPRRTDISDEEALDWIGEYTPPDYFHPRKPDSIASTVTTQQ
ncbi:MAG: hypothetical protein AAFX06_03260 [Planctomycetota bacterium]